MPAIAKLERTGDRAVVDDVAVALGPGVQGRVKGLGSFAGIEHADIGGQQGVQGSNERLG